MGMKPGYPRTHRRSRVKREIPKQILGPAVPGCLASRTRLPQGQPAPPGRVQPDHWPVIIAPAQGQAEEDKRRPPLLTKVNRSGWVQASGSRGTGCPLSTPSRTRGEEPAQPTPGSLHHLAFRDARATPTLPADLRDSDRRAVDATRHACVSFQKRPAVLPFRKWHTTCTGSSTSSACRIL